jgi:hypothetical protein
LNPECILSVAQIHREKSKKYGGQSAPAKTPIGYRSHQPRHQPQPMPRYRPRVGCVCFCWSTSGDPLSLTGHLTHAHCLPLPHAASYDLSGRDPATPLSYPFRHADHHPIAVLAGSGSQGARQPIEPTAAPAYGIHRLFATMLRSAVR